MSERIVVDHIISKEVTPELISKVVGVVRQEGADVEIQQPLGKLCHHFSRAENQPVGILGQVPFDGPCTPGFSFEPLLMSKHLIVTAVLVRHSSLRKGGSAKTRSNCSRRLLSTFEGQVVEKNTRYPQFLSNQFHLQGCLVIKEVEI